MTWGREWSQGNGGVGDNGFFSEDNVTGSAASFWGAQEDLSGQAPQILAYLWGAVWSFLLLFFNEEEYNCLVALLKRETSGGPSGEKRTL